MRRCLLAFSLSLFACHDTAPTPALVHIDISPLQRAAQTAQLNVSKVGLLAVQGPPADPTAAQQQMQSASGATASTTAANPTSGDQSKVANPNDVPVTGGATQSSTGGSPDITGALSGGSSDGAARDSTTSGGSDGGSDGTTGSSSGTTQTSTSSSSSGGSTGTGSSGGISSSGSSSTGGSSSGGSSGSGSSGALGSSASSGGASANNNTSGVTSTASPKAATADVVIASLAAGAATADVVPKFGYYPVQISADTLSFDVAIPSGKNQTLYFLAFITDATTGADTPVYIGEKTGVDLDAAATVQLNFDIYQAGTVRPEILTPSTLGLTDTNGNTVSSVPSLSCLAVATSTNTFAGFPSVTASRLPVGALSQLSAAQIGTGAMILPAGDWGIDCYANFAGHLFGVSADRPLVVTVAQGQLYAPSAPLVIVKDLPASDSSSASGSGGSSGGSGASSGGAGGTGSATAREKAPHLAVKVGFVGTAGLGSPVGSGANAGSNGNFTTQANQDVTVSALDDSGNIDTTFNGVVRLTVVTLGGKEVFPAAWQPFDANHQSLIPHSTDVSLSNGTATLTGLLQTSALAADTLTHHFLMTAQALDASGNSLDPSGAAAMTVRSDALCSSDAVQNAGIGALTPFTLTLAADTVAATLDTSGTYTEPTVPLMVLASSGGVNDCLIGMSSNDALSFNDISPGAVLAEPNPSFIVNGGGFVVPLPAAPNAQWLFWDAFSLAPAFLTTNSPSVGASTTVTLPYQGPNQTSGQLQLNAVVIASP